jgi:hypothetical protein
MKAEMGAATENTLDGKASSESNPAARTRKGKRRPSLGSSPGSSVRFFLAKSDGGNGTPSLDREFESEPEAIVESLKTGKHYFVISEWKGLADLTKRIPLIRKEVVSHQRSSSHIRVGGSLS